MRLALLMLLALIAAPLVPAQAQTAPAVPAALEDWRAWVLKDYEFRACPAIVNLAPDSEDAFICAWPGRLALAANSNGASFKQRWRVEAPSWVPLPGDAQVWPQQVEVNGERRPLLAHGGYPALRLDAGTYELSGSFTWVRRPEALRVPNSVGLVELSVDGARVFPIEREGDKVWLGRAQATVAEAESLTVEVYRKLSDGVPIRMVTLLRLDVSGEGREENLGKALPKDFSPLALTGGLPAKLEADGTLKVQVRPGSWELTLDARATRPQAMVEPVLPGAPWPEEEVWSYEAAPQLRVTNAISALPIDAAQAGVPDAWRALPAFAMGKGAKLEIEERTRGLAAEEANRLNLQREAWLDFNGAGINARDQIYGRMVRDWRLDMAAPYALLRGEADGRGLLITRGEHPGFSGVELRNPTVNLNAGLRIEQAGGSLPINGWRESFDAVSLTLHLPVAYRLIAAPGADEASGTWAAQWTLLDVFIVAVIALLSFKLLGILPALAVSIYLVLSYQEPDAPLWLLAAGFAVALLVRWLPDGKLAAVLRAARVIALGALILFALPFIAIQIRLALYPQLESSQSGYGMFADMQTLGGAIEEADYANAPPPAAPPATMAPPMPQQAAEMEMMQKSVEQRAPVGKSGLASSVGDKMDYAQSNADNLRRRAARLEQRYAANTVLQAGRGQPEWNWGSTYRLSWSGPVLPDQEVRLVWSPPWLTRALRGVMVGLLGLVIFLLLRGARRGPAATGKLATALVAAALLLPATVMAQNTPAPELLEELRERLLEAPKCAPHCGQIANADVAASGTRLNVVLEVHAGERVALPLPGAEEALDLTTITMDGVAVDGLTRRDDGSLWIALQRGVHRVEAVYTVAPVDQLGLRFPLRPARVRFNGEGWEASGLSEERLLTETLDLVRVRAADETSSETVVAGQQFPPFVAVSRDLRLELDWTLDNQVVRWSPQEGGLSVDLPLVAGERVMSSELKVRDGKVTIPFQAGQFQNAWQGQLDRAETITLVAPDLAGRREVWTVSASQMWHVEHAGVPPVASEVSGDFWIHEFHPLPGEKLTLTILRPEALPGDSLAIDAVSLSSQIGKRATEHTLNLRLRSTQGGQHAIALPADAEVLGVSMDGATLNVRPEDGKLTLPIRPGLQNVQVRWRENAEIPLRARSPEVNLNAAASNLSFDLMLPVDRWVLFARGPQIGPAVLYWGELLVLAVLAWLLARTRRTPLKFHHWLLLGLGFSTFSWWLLLVVVAWLLALDWREKGADFERKSVSLWPIGIALFLVAAPLFALAALPSMLSGSEVLTGLMWIVLGAALLWIVWMISKRDATALGRSGFNLVQIGLVGLSAIAVICLLASMERGLLGTPDMHLTGNGSVPTDLRWFQDQSTDVLPEVEAFSVPIWVYKTAMLVWALWLSFAFVGWLRWGLAAWSKGGYWRSKPKAVTPAAAAAPETTADPAGAGPAAP